MTLSEVIQLFQKLMKKTVTILMIIIALTTAQAQENKFNLVVGTYTKPCDSKGIYVYEFDSKTGEFSLKNNTENIIAIKYDNEKISEEEIKALLR